MPTPELSVAAILAEMKDSLRTARIGHHGFLSPEAGLRRPGLRNAVVFGHASTIALQRLRSRDSRFDEWWAVKVAELAADPGFRRLMSLRNEILKQGLGTSSVGTSIHIGHLNSRDLEPLMSNPPPGAAGFFVGDQSGGSGWSIPRQDGTEDVFYVELPPSVKMASSFTIDVGEERADMKRLLHRWLTHLEAIHADALELFARHA